MQLQELNNRFTEVNTKFLFYVASLNPTSSFSSCDKERVVHLAQLDASDFSAIDLVALDHQLKTKLLICYGNEF